MASKQALNAALRDLSREWLIRDVRSTAESSRRIRGLLSLLEADLVRQVGKHLDSGSAADDPDRRRMAGLLLDVRASLGERSKQLQYAQSYEMSRTYAMRMSDAAKDMNGLMRADLFRATLNPTEIGVVARGAHVAGLGQTGLEDWWGEFSAKAQGRAASQIQIGYLQGETNSQLVGRLIGVGTGKKIPVTIDGKTVLVPEYTGGAINASRNEAMMLVRTMSQSASNSALAALYEENADVVKGFECIATLDNRTSEFCMARDGARWNLKGGLLPDSPVRMPYPGYPPPWHPNCRTVLSPITYSWEELIERETGEKKKILDTVPNSVRASMDGEVPGRETWEDFLESKGDSWAKDKLGAENYTLWKKGKVTFTQLMDGAGDLSPAQYRNLQKHSIRNAPTFAQMIEDERKAVIQQLEDDKVDIAAKVEEEADDRILEEIDNHLARLRALLDDAPTEDDLEDEDEDE